MTCLRSLEGAPPSAGQKTILLDVPIPSLTRSCSSGEVLLVPRTPQVAAAAADRESVVGGL